MSDLKKMYRAMQDDPFPDEMRLILGESEVRFRKRTWNIGGEIKGLRYGENPDQPAALYEPVAGGLTVGGVAFRGPGRGLVCCLTEENMLQSGKHPGKINLTDVDNGLNILQYLAARPAAVILKHNNPCGAAWSESGLTDAFERAFASDRIAAFGGTIVVNRLLDAATATLINASYFEVVAAPEFESEALAILKSKKNLRILRIPGIAELPSYLGQPFLDVKSLLDGGLIVQFSFENKVRRTGDFLPAQATSPDGTVVAARAPNAKEAADLLFAWAVEAGVSSNSVIFAKDGATVAIGAGEQDRVGCVDLAIHKALTKYADLACFKTRGISLYDLALKAQGDPQAAKDLAAFKDQARENKAGLPGSVMVSDGFFPFRDGVDLAIAQGVTAIAQPGGSLRDAEVIEAVNQAAPQVAMVFTGQRSFKH